MPKSFKTKGMRDGNGKPCITTVMSHCFQEVFFDTFCLTLLVCFRCLDDSVRVASETAVPDHAPDIPGAAHATGAGVSSQHCRRHPRSVRRLVEAL